MNLFIKSILLGGAVLLVQSVVADRLYGLERMERFDLLPYFLEGTQVRQVSSRDRDGGNDDGFNSTYSYLYKDGNGAFVIFDEKVPGCIYRLWMTFSLGEPLDSRMLRFYFDGETVPSLSISVADFFRGTISPFLFPMVGNRAVSSEGFYSYYPFPYAGSLKITISQINEPFFYNITYHQFDSSEGVATWTGVEDEAAAVAMLGVSGTDPKTTNNNLIVEGEVSITDGSLESLFSMGESGVIQSLKMELGTQSSNVLSELYLVMNWDGGDAEVDVPIGEFFGFNQAGISVESLPVGMNVNGSCYCYFPMPFWASAEVYLRNESAENLLGLAYEIQYTTNRYDQIKSGYFHALHNRESFVADDKDYNILMVKGRGHLVGVSLSMLGLGTTGWYGMGYLEGDERVYIDGSRSPAIYGTGTEDYFNGGWYFKQGAFSLPFHGNPYQSHRSVDHDLSSSRTQAYRFHLTDVIPFRTSLKFGIEHGSNYDESNQDHGTYSSVAYYYKATDESSGMVLTANLDLGDAWSESLYDYQLSVTGNVVSNTWNYEGDDDDIDIVDDGYHYTGAVAEFTVPLMENAGVLLRRRTDQGIGGQTAQVFVDDTYAGIWYEADHNFGETSKRWLDSEFMVSSNLVAGKPTARISIVPLSSSNPWNEYRYWVYCIKPLKFIEDSDNDQLPDEWELEMVPTLGTLHGNIDSDGDGFSDLSEYIAGTHPTNSASFFAIHSGLQFQSEIGRLYHLQQSTNLIIGGWQTIRSDVPGTGHLMILPVETTEPSAYHRLQVEKP